MNCPQPNVKAPLSELRAVVFVDEASAGKIANGSDVTLQFSSGDSEIRINGTVKGITELASMNTYVVHIV